MQKTVKCACYDVTSQFPGPVARSVVPLGSIDRLLLRTSTVRLSVRSLPFSCGVGLRQGLKQAAKRGAIAKIMYGMPMFTPELDEALRKASEARSFTCRVQVVGPMTTGS